MKIVQTSLFTTLPQNIQDEIQQLAERYGDPLVSTAQVTTGKKFDPLSKKDRYGEVCMVVRRKNGRLLTMTKTYYPKHAYRLLTGGINHGEGILDALLRETHEETGLEVHVNRFLTAITYTLQQKPEEPVFYTFAFLLDEVSGTLGAIDIHERVEDYGEIEPAELLPIAETLDHLDANFAQELLGHWNEWGKFRAVVHRKVYEALQKP
jgi:8-oxo-dGTP pyrophosphatase MutT (NUDIX family)